MNHPCCRWCRCSVSTAGPADCFVSIRTTQSFIVWGRHRPARHRPDAGVPTGRSGTNSGSVPWSDWGFFQRTHFYRVILPPQGFWAQLGQMRRRFSMLDNPLSIILMMSRGGRESCSSALRTLRSRGICVDEVYCLAGAPRGPILSLLHAHFLLSDGFSGPEEWHDGLAVTRPKK